MQVLQVKVGDGGLGVLGNTSESYPGGLIQDWDLFSVLASAQPPFALPQARSVGSLRKYRLLYLDRREVGGGGTKGSQL